MAAPNHDRIERCFAPLWIALWIGTAALIALAARHVGGRVWAEAAGLFATSIVGGRFLIFAGLHEGFDLGPWEIAALLLVFDLHQCFAVAFALDRFEGHGRIGRWLARMRERARHVLASYPGFRRLAFAGLALFVALPLAGTGSITGSFAARLMGMPRLVGVAGVMLGQLLVSAAFAGLASALGAEAERIAKNPWLAGSLALLFAFAVWLGYRRVRRELARA